MNSKLLNQLVLVALPIAAIVVIWIVHSQLGGLAPAPPVSIPERESTMIVPRPKFQETTVFAPQGSENDLPPGGESLSTTTQLEYRRDDDELRLATPVPIMELKPPANRK